MTNNKIFTLVSLSCLSVSLIAQPVNDHNHIDNQALMADNLAITVLRYQNQDNQQRVTSQRASYHNDCLDTGSAIIQQTTISDAFTGQVLASQYGKNDADSTRTQYDALGEPTQIQYTTPSIKPVTQTLQYSWDASMRKVTVIHPGGGYQTTTVTNALGQQQYSYDNLPQHKKNNQPIHLVDNQYNDLGQLAEQQSKGETTRTSYDAQGRALVSKIDVPLAGEQRIHRVEQHSRFDDVNNTVTQYTQGESFNRGDNSLRQAHCGDDNVDCTGERIKQLDDSGQLIQQTDAGNSASASALIGWQTHDNFGDTFKDINALAATRNSQAIAQQQLSYTYNALGEQTQTSRQALTHNDSPSPSKVTAVLQLDINGNVQQKKLIAAGASESQDKGNTHNYARRYTYLYDMNNNQRVQRRYTSDTDDSQYIEQDTRSDDNGYTITVSNWHPQNTSGATWKTLTYVDRLGKKVLASVHYTHGKTIHYTYETTTGKVSNITTYGLSQDDNSTISYRYQANGLLSRQIEKIGKNGPQVLSYTYYQHDKKNLDRLKTLTTKIGSTGIRSRTEYRYDALSQSATLYLDNTTSKPRIRSETQFNGLNQPQTVDRYYWNSAGEPQRIDSLIYRYDAHGRIKSLQQLDNRSNTQSTIHYLQYRYNAEGNIASKIDGGGLGSRERIDYTYDNLNQHLYQSVTHKNTGYRDATTITRTYDTDLLGNVWSDTIDTQTTGPQGIDLTSTKHQYQYDAQDRITRADNETMMYDTAANRTNLGSAGNLTQVRHITEGKESFTQLRYNLANQLVSDNDGKHPVTHYHYAGTQMRDEVQQNDTSIDYIYDTEKNLIGSVQTGGKSAGDSVIYFNGGQARLVRDSQGQLMRCEFYGKDANGSVINELSINAKGTWQRADYQYDDLGKRIDKGPKDTGILDLQTNPMQFGLTHDSTGLDYKRHRYTMTFAGLPRFITRDFGGYHLMSDYALDDGDDMVNERDVEGFVAFSKFAEEAEADICSTFVNFAGEPEVAAVETVVEVAEAADEIGVPTVEYKALKRYGEEGFRFSDYGKNGRDAQGYDYYGKREVKVSVPERSKEDIQAAKEERRRERLEAAEVEEEDRRESLEAAEAAEAELRRRTYVEQRRNESRMRVIDEFEKEYGKKLSFHMASELRFSCISLYKLQALLLQNNASKEMIESVFLTNNPLSEDALEEEVIKRWFPGVNLFQE